LTKRAFSARCHNPDNTWRTLNVLFPLRNRVPFFFSSGRVLFSPFEMPSKIDPLAFPEISFFWNKERWKHLLASIAPPLIAIYPFSLLRRCTGLHHKVPRKTAISLRVENLSQPFRPLIFPPFRFLPANILPDAPAADRFRVADGLQRCLYSIIGRVLTQLFPPSPYFTSGST